MASNNSGVSYYAGVGASFDTVNPWGLVEWCNDNVTGERFQNKVNSFSGGLYFSPKIFIGLEQGNFYKDWALRVQAGVDFHTMSIKNRSIFVDNQANTGTLSLNPQFHYTYSLAAHLKKKIAPKLEGYMGMGLLASWTSVGTYVSNLANQEIQGNLTHQFMFGVSPQIGLIYHASDKMFYYLDGHCTFYKRLVVDGILVDTAVNAHLQPIWAGIGLGVGWKL